MGKAAEAFRGYLAFKIVAVFKVSTVFVILNFPALSDQFFQSVTPELATSPGKVIQEDVRGLCESVIPTYAESFAKGGWDVVTRALAENQQYKNLDPFQQRAFARLLGQFIESESPRDVTSRCHELLNSEALKAIGKEQIEYCEAWARTVFRVARLESMGGLSDENVDAIAGGNEGLRGVIRSVANQASQLEQGVSPEEMARAHYYTCYSNFLTERE